MATNIVSITAAAGEFLSSRLTPRLQETIPAVPSGVEVVDAASRTISLLVWAILLLILLPVLFIVYRKLFATLGTKEAPPRDPRLDAARLEKKGDFRAAAVYYEQTKDYDKAAALFEKGRDLSRAAEMYEAGGDFTKAAELYLRSGGSEKAAGMLIKSGDYVGAAKIFKNKGDHLRAAQALELYGNKAAAAREYKEARQFEKAAKLLREEGMVAEAAESYGSSLENEELDHSNTDRFYTYAAFLALADEKERAASIYRSILLLKGDYKKVRGNLRAIGYDDTGRPLTAEPVPPSPSPSAEPAPAAHPPSPASAIDEGYSAAQAAEDRLQKESSLRKMIDYGRLDPRYSMRLWIQIMRALAEKHREQTFYGCLTPETIFIDMENNVRIEAPESLIAAYTAPEVKEGQAPGPHSDVYAMGVILFEMVTGSLSSLGEKKPSEIGDDVPDWLDELIVNCTQQDRRNRYLNTDEISSALVKIKSTQNRQ